MKPPDLVPEGFTSTHRRGAGETTRFCIKCSENMLQFGSGDLVLEVPASPVNFRLLSATATFDFAPVTHVQGDMQQCTSHLDRSYGFGLNSSGDTSRFLCGANHFAVEEVEIWEIF